MAVWEKLLAAPINSPDYELYALYVSIRLFYLSQLVPLLIVRRLACGSIEKGQTLDRIFACKPMPWQP